MASLQKITSLCRLMLKSAYLPSWDPTNGQNKNHPHHSDRILTYFHNPFSVEPRRTNVPPETIYFYRPKCNFSLNQIIIVISPPLAPVVTPVQAKAEMINLAVGWHSSQKKTDIPTKRPMPVSKTQYFSMGLFAASSYEAGAHPFSTQRANQDFQY